MFLESISSISIFIFSITDGCKDIWIKKMDFSKPLLSIYKLLLNWLIIEKVAVEIIFKKYRKHRLYFFIQFNIVILDSFSFFMKLYQYFFNYVYKIIMSFTLKTIKVLEILNYMAFIWKCGTIRHSFRNVELFTIRLSFKNVKLKRHSFRNVKPYGIHLKMWNYTTFI